MSKIIDLSDIKKLISRKKEKKEHKTEKCASIEDGIKAMNDVDYFELDNKIKFLQPYAAEINQNKNFILQQIVNMVSLLEKLDDSGSAGYILNTSNSSKFNYQLIAVPK